MTAVSDSSPLIILAKLGCFDCLKTVFQRIFVSAEVYREVVVAGAGLPGSAEVARSDWIEQKEIQDRQALHDLQQRHALGLGELSSLLLAKQLNATVVLMDDYGARKLARAEGLRVRGTVGLLETFHLRGGLVDLRAAFRQLVAHSYIDKRLLDFRLRALGLPIL